MLYLKWHISPISHLWLDILNVKNVPLNAPLNTFDTQYVLKVCLTLWDTTWKHQIKLVSVTPPTVWCAVWAVLQKPITMYVLTVSGVVSSLNREDGRFFPENGTSASLLSEQPSVMSGWENRGFYPIACVSLILCFVDPHASASLLILWCSLWSLSPGYSLHRKVHFS